MATGRTVDPQSPSGWLSLARQHEVSARLLAENRDAAAQAYGHVGFAAECAVEHRGLAFLDDMLRAVLAAA